MLLPISSDAPLRFWPIATVTMIVINVLAFIWQFPYPDDWLILSHGDGLHPVQWLTSGFMHSGPAHLIGNMIFLWLFGHIVEGRCGPWIFAGLFVGIGIVQNALEQFLMLFAGDGGSLGASSAIYGIMMIAGLWTAKCNIHCIYVLFYRIVGRIEIPILIFAAFYFLWDFGIALLTGFAMSTPFLHSMGAIVGLLVGGIFLWHRWVDCDDLDVRSMYEESFGKPATLSKREEAEQQKKEEKLRRKREQRLKQLEQSIEMHLQAGNPQAAGRQLHVAQRIGGKLDWLERRTRQVLTAYQKARLWDSLIECSHFYLRNFEKSNPPAAASIRINLAHLAVHLNKAPRQALRILSQLSENQLTPSQKIRRSELGEFAKLQIDGGTLDIAKD